MVSNAMNYLPTQSQAYQGPFVAQADPYQTKQVTDAYSAAAGQAGNLSGWLNQQIQNAAPTLSAPSYTTSLPANYNYNMGDRQANLDQVIQASTAPIMKQLMQQTLPSLKSSALDAGAYTGDRALNIQPDQAIQEATKNANDLALQLGYQDYNNWENRRLQAYQTDQNAQLQAYQEDTARQAAAAQQRQQWLGMLPDLTNTVLSQQTAQGDILGRIADINKQTQQDAINNALTQEQYNFTRPFMGLDTAANLFRDLSGNYGTTTGQSQQQTVQQTGGLGAIAQGILGAGLGIGSMFMPSAPLSGLFGKLGSAAATAPSAISVTRGGALPS
jgi:hypothetical protein